MESKKVLISFILVAPLLASSQLALATPDDFHVVVKRENCKRDDPQCHNNRRSAAAGKANGGAFRVLCSSVMIAAATLAV